MSNEWVTRCKFVKVKPTEKQVLICLADWVRDDKGSTWPSIKSLTTWTCLSERTVQRAIRSLEREGWLTIIPPGLNRANTYVLNAEKLLELDIQEKARELADLKAAIQARRKELCGPAEGVSLTGCQSDGGVTVTPDGCQSDTRTVNTLLKNTPHTPQPPAGGLKASDENAGGQPLLSLVDWLRQVQASGQDAVPESDEVWNYAAAVGLPREFVALCWREFKRRQMQSGKRRRDWRSHFRECVMGSWYKLWMLSAGQDARLSTAGEQATRFFEALDCDDAGTGGGE